MTTKNCVNGPKLVLKDLRKKSFVRNVRLPFFQIWQCDDCAPLCGRIKGYFSSTTISKFMNWIKSSGIKRIHKDAKNVKKIELHLDLS